MYTYTFVLFLIKTFKNECNNVYCTCIIIYIKKLIFIIQVKLVQRKNNSFSTYRKPTQSDSIISNNFNHPILKSLYI